MSNSSLYRSASPRITLVLVIFSLIDEQLCVLMVKQKEPSFTNSWGLPTGEVNCELDSTLELAAKRNIKKFSGIDTLYLEQVQTIGNKVRDPRGWSIAVVYYSLICEVNKKSAQDTLWMPVAQALTADLCFDHQQIMQSCVHRLQNKSLYTSLPIFLLPQTFTLTELQRAYELILDFKMEKKSFRRRLLDAGFLQKTGQTRHANHRPAFLYRLAQMQPYYFPRIIEGVRENRNIED